MKNRIIFIVLIVSVIILSSCFKEEEIMTLPPRSSELQVGKIEQSIYNHQIFYDLKTNAVVKSNLNTAWDLGFACSDTTWHIILNNSKLMHAGNSWLTDFTQVTSTLPDDSMYFDHSAGAIDSIAIRNIFSETLVPTNFVYVIDRGKDSNSNSLGYKKIQILAPAGSSYFIRYANLDGSDEQTVQIDKDADKNYVCFSFDNGVVDIEPDKSDWTILFSSYQTMLETGTGKIPYWVRGVLLNPYKVKAAVDSTSIFDEITLSDTASLNILCKRDVIGHAWKYYDLSSGFYTVASGMQYVIKNQEGYFYKLRFVSYYNEQNQKGFPVFEYLQL